MHFLNFEYFIRMLRIFVFEMLEFELAALLQRSVHVPRRTIDKRHYRPIAIELGQVLNEAKMSY